MSNTLKLGNGQWATGKDTLLSFSDTNNNYKPLPFSFSRNSSATVVNKDGLIETVGSGEPRIDFKDNTKGALKLEPSRSNVLPYSNKFLNTGWQYYRGTIIANATISPDGTLNASRYQEDSQTGSHLFRRQSLSITNELSYTGSIFAKKGELSSIILQSNSSSRWVASATFNLENGTVTSGTGVIENYGNGWYRCSISGDAVQTTPDAGFEIYTSVGAGRDGDGLFMYGAMFEQGGYATSYIPTSGSAVTRVADSSSQTVPNGVIGQTEGTVFAEVNISSIESVGVYSGWKVDGTSGNQLAFIMYPTGRIQATVFNGNSLVVNINDNNYGLTSGIHKIAFAYRQNDYILYVDGSVVGSDTSATVPIVNDFDISYLNGGSIKYNQTKLYNTRLSNSELAALTTI